MKASDRPAVSVILPTFNRAAVLPRSIASVLGQSFADFELVVIDDGSEDDTAEVVLGFDDSRVRYRHLGGNHGLSAARNAGLAMARGIFLAFQDSDDEWHTEKLQRQLAVMAEHPAAAVVYSDMVRQLYDGRRFYFRSPDIVRGRLIDPETRYWQTYMLAMQPSLIRCAAAVDLRFDEKLELFEDLDFHLRLARDHVYVHLHEPLVTYHESSGLTAGGLLEAKARWSLVRKYGADLARQAPGFLLREPMNIVLRRSLMPIVRQHLSPL